MPLDWKKNLDIECELNCYVRSLKFPSARWKIIEDEVTTGNCTSVPLSVYIHQSQSELQMTMTTMVTVATTTITPETMMVIIQFISILVYLRAN
jgi:hypothetical protein